MKRNTKTLLFLVTLVCVVAAFAVCAFASDTAFDYTGVAGVTTYVDQPGYDDIYYSKTEGFWFWQTTTYGNWIQVATSSSSNKKDNGDGAYNAHGDLHYGSGYKAYYNGETKTLVIIGASASSLPTASYGHTTNTTLGVFPNWCTQNASKVEHVEFRNIGGFNYAGYIISPLKNVKTIKVDSAASTLNGTKSDTAVFANLTSLTTVGWGSWASDGTWTASSYYEDGVVDLRGHTSLKPSHTSSKDVPDLTLYLGAAIRKSTSVKKVILPSSLRTDNSATLLCLKLSDGSSSFPLYDGSGNVASGSVGYQLRNTSTGAIAYNTSSTVPLGWEAVKLVANEIAPYNGQFEDMIAYDFAYGATSLETVVVPAGVTLHRIYKNAFTGCTSLREIIIEGDVADDFTVDVGAFGPGTGNVSEVKIYISGTKNQRLINNALSAAGYTDRAKVMAFCESVESPIDADGFQIKINTEYNGLRGLFTFDEGSKATYAEIGYNFVEYGVIVCTKTVASQHSSKDALLASTNSKVKKIVVENVDGTGENRWVNYEKRQFCIALTGIPEGNSMDDVYFLAYSTWTDDSGAKYNLYTEYIAEDEEPYANIYEVTLGLFKNGLVNTETIENAGGNADAIIWKTLKKGAVTVAKSAFGTPGTPKNNSTSTTYKLNVSATYNSDGSFTYLDLPLHATTGATNANYSYNPSNFETTASTNVLWSLYQDGTDYVALYRRDPSAASDAKAFLPTQTISSYGGVHPFRENYGTLITNKVSGDVTIYSPVLSATNAAKVKTLIIDYGVNSTEARTSRNGSLALGNAKYTETIVYPNDFTVNTSSQSLFRNNTNLKNVIWANKPADTQAQKYHMGDVEGNLSSLADLRGMGKIHPEAAFMDSGIENMVFVGYSADSHTQTYAGMKSLNRVWIDGEGQTTAPAEKTVDLTGDTKVTKLGRQCFAFAADDYTVKLSDKVSTVSKVGSSGSYMSAFAATFGAKHIFVNVDAPNAAFPASFYDYYLSFIETDYRTNANNVCVNGKFYYEIAEDVCFEGESFLEIFPELPAQVNRDYAYKVTVHQGSESATLPVYNHTMFNGVGDRGIGADMYRRYSTFAFTGEQVRVDIKVGTDFTSYGIIPSAKNFESTFDASTGTISVYLDEPDYFGIRLDDDDNSIISIFAENPEYPHVTNLVNGKGGAIVFESGTWYKPTHGDGITQTTSEHTGALWIETPDTAVYIQPGAVVYGRIRFTAAAVGSSVVGYGAIIDCFADNRVMDIRQGGTEGGGMYNSAYKCQMMQSSASNFIYDGPTIMDARSFHVVLGGINVRIRNYKAMSTMMTTDGITEGIKKNGVFEHCWLYVGDNALVISGSTGSYYNDIVIGTTCAAVFPQGNVTNALLENISVFRSNDGIINHRYNPNNKDLVLTMTVRNFDCVDTINYPQFWSGYKMGMSTQKVINFENVTLPYSSGVTNPHSEAVNNTWSTKNRLVSITQPEGTTCGNYTMNFVNTYMDGVLLDSEDKAVLSVTLPSDVAGAYMKYTFGKANNGFTPPTRQKNTVNYTATNKVYIGTLLIHFDEDVIIEGNTFYLPANEILTKLRTTVKPTTVTKNGIAYVAHTTLKTSGAASNVAVSGGNLTITPVAPSATTNLIIQNSGLVTREYESTCYNIDLVQKDGVMYAYPTSSGYNGGICYNMTEEIRMYGAGTYKITLKAMCQINDGGAYSPVKLIFNYDTAAKYTKNEKAFTLTADWTEYTYEFTVTEDMLKNGISFGAVGIAASGNVPVQYYAVKDMTVTKIS
ncbi:MAG: hypothetical protein J6B55_01810 [Clostridia bacterium]|nr:hypothetical protein [Clostridia bacterium]